MSFRIYGKYQMRADMLSLCTRQLERRCLRSKASAKSKLRRSKRPSRNCRSVLSLRVTCVIVNTVLRLHCTLSESALITVSALAHNLRLHHRRRARSPEEESREDIDGKQAAGLDTGRVCCKHYTLHNATTLRSFKRLPKHEYQRGTVTSMG